MDFTPIEIPKRPTSIYAEYQGGNLTRYHLATGETKEIRPLPGEGEEDYRFNWNTALHLSPSTPGTIYYGGQYLFRSPDRGESWEKISPDLTTNDPQRQRQKQSGGLTIGQLDGREQHHDLHHLGIAARLAR